MADVKKLLKSIMMSLWVCWRTSMIGVMGIREIEHINLSQCYASCELFDKRSYTCAYTKANDFLRCRHKCCSHKNWIEFRTSNICKVLNTKSFLTVTIFGFVAMVTVCESCEFYNAWIKTVWRFNYLIVNYNYNHIHCPIVTSVEG